MECCDLVSFLVSIPLLWILELGRENRFGLMVSLDLGDLSAPGDIGSDEVDLDLLLFAVFCVTFGITLGSGVCLGLRATSFSKYILSCSLILPSELVSALVELKAVHGGEVTPLVFLEGTSFEEVFELEPSFCLLLPASFFKL